MMTMIIQMALCIGQKNRESSKKKQFKQTRSLAGPENCHKEINCKFGESGLFGYGGEEGGQAYSRRRVDHSIDLTAWMG